MSDHPKSGRRAPNPLTTNPAWTTYREPIHMANARSKLLRYDESETSVASRPIRVLLAEDDPEMRRLVAERLRHEGFEVLEAKDGLQLDQLVRTALLRATREGIAVDLVVSDVRMPGRTGLQALADLRRIDGTTPFILITAFGDAELHDEAHRLGATAVFDKPFELDDLCAKVSDLVTA
jgi:CheY-like chemotaxis protein